MLPYAGQWNCGSNYADLPNKGEPRRVLGGESGLWRTVNDEAQGH